MSTPLTSDVRPVSAPAVSALQRVLDSDAGRTSQRPGGHVQLDSLHELYVDELKDLYNAEQQILKALPQMIKAASSRELKRAFTDH